MPKGFVATRLQAGWFRILEPLMLTDLHVGLEQSLLGASRFVAYSAYFSVLLSG